MKNEHMDEVWRTKDGKEIPICQMSEDHAKNILRTLMRHKRFNEEREELMDNIMEVDRW